MKNQLSVSLDDLPGFTQNIIKQITENDVISLIGEIGSGKTTFVFTVMQQLGLTKSQPFSSPTFTILNQYQLNPWKVNHVDLYRLNRYEELETLDIIFNFFEPQTITFIEWGDKFKELQDKITKKISFAYGQHHANERLIALEGFSI